MAAPIPGSGPVQGSGSDDKQSIWTSPRTVKMFANADKFTGIFAEELLKQSGIDREAQNYDELVVLDNACGAGVVSMRLMNLLDDKSKAKLDLTCADFSQPMIDFVSNRMKSSADEEGWALLKQTQAVTADAQDTKLPSDHFTHIFFNFGPFLIPSPTAALNECHRMLRSNGSGGAGILGFSTWQTPGWVEDMRAAFASNPNLPPMPSNATILAAFATNDDASAPRWDVVDDVAARLKAHGFVEDEITVRTFTGRTTLKDVDEFVDLIPVTLGVVFTKFWTAEQREKLEDEAKRTAEKFMRDKYGSDPVTWESVAILGTARKGKKGTV